MGASSKPLIVALDLEGKDERLNLPLLINPLEAQQSKHRRYSNGAFRSRRRISSSRNLLKGSRKPINVVEKRVRTLRKLVPSTKPVGLDGLFREAADYIVDLQLRVELMQNLVDMFAGSDE